MIALKQVLVVEGRYDKNRLKQIFDATVIDTAGFGIFRDDQKLALLRRLAMDRGIVILTDADGAGLVIRNYLKGAIGQGQVFHAYIPGLPGKERRKRQPGREGLLGVEGMSNQVIIDAVMRSGVQAAETSEQPGQPISKADFYALGYSGGPGSRAKRQALCRRLELPDNLSANSLLEVLNILGGHAILGDCNGREERP